MRSIELLEEFGPSVGMPHVRHLEEDIYELRTKFSTNIFRTLFFHYKDGQLVLTQSQLAKAIKTKQSVISRIENWNHNISIATIKTLAKALEVPTSVILRPIKEDDTNIAPKQLKAIKAKKVLN